MVEAEEVKAAKAAKAAIEKILKNIELDKIEYLNQDKTRRDV